MVRATAGKAVMRASSRAENLSSGLKRWSSYVTPLAMAAPKTGANVAVPEEWTKAVARRFWYWYAPEEVGRAQ
jgi:hypothetical protein